MLNNNPICDKFLQPQDTRLTHPSDVFRGMYFSQQFDYPIVDPQAGVFYGFDPTTDRNRCGASTRLFIRDNYEIKKLVPFDKGVIRPSERKERRDMPDVSMCAEADLSQCTPEMESGKGP